MTSRRTRLGAPRPRLPSLNDLRDFNYEALTDSFGSAVSELVRASKATIIPSWARVNGRAERALQQCRGNETRVACNDTTSLPWEPLSGLALKTDECQAASLTLERSATLQRKNQRYLVDSVSNPACEPVPAQASFKLIDDRLIHELLELAPIPGPVRTRRLRHQHGDELLFGIDPEERARVACPHELAL